MQILTPSHRPVLTANRIFGFGVQYPEILQVDSPAEQQNKAVEAIQRLYSEHPPTPPASPPPDGPDQPARPIVPFPRFPAGCIPWSSWKETKGYPANLPRMSTPPSPSPHLTFLKRN